MVKNWNNKYNVKEKFLAYDSNIVEKNISKIIKENPQIIFEAEKRQGPSAKHVYERRINQRRQGLCITFETVYTS